MFENEFLIDEAEEQELMEQEYSLEKIYEEELNFEENPEIAIDENISPQEEIIRRELFNSGLSRIEDAARKQKHFEDLIKLWDRLDANRERRERYHEIGRGDVPLDYNAAEDGRFFPDVPNRPLTRQIQKGEFIDAIHFCPFEFHEILSDPKLSKLIKELPDKQKEILFFSGVKLYSAKRIAKMRGQTDRNIRKMKVTIKKNLDKKIADLKINEDGRYTRSTYVFKKKKRKGKKDEKSV